MTAIQLTRLTIAFGGVSDIWFVVLLTRADENYVMVDVHHMALFPALLAGAGVGCIGVVDGDVVEVSNLHRQTLHSEATVGMHKVVSCKLAVERLNSDVALLAYPFHLDADNALGLVEEFDVDEDVIRVGVRLLARTVIDWFKPAGC